MAAVQKFLFDTDFDDPVPPGRGGAAGRRDKEIKPPEPPPPPPPPTFSEAELEAARRQARAEGEAAGREQGHAQGVAETEARIEAQLSDAYERLVERLELLMADRDAANEVRTTEPLRIGLAVIDRVLPEYIQRYGTAEIEAFMTQCLSEAIDEPRITFRVAEGVVGKIKPRLEQLAEERGFAGRLVVLGDASLGPADARVEWAEGGAERDTEQILQDIGAIASRLLGGE